MKRFTSGTLIKHLTGHALGDRMQCMVHEPIID